MGNCTRGGEDWGNADVGVLALKWSGDPCLKGAVHFLAVRSATECRHRIVGDTLGLLKSRGKSLQLRCIDSCLLCGIVANSTWDCYFSAKDSFCDRRGGVPCCIQHLVCLYLKTLINLPPPPHNNLGLVIPSPHLFITCSSSSIFQVHSPAQLAPLWCVH